jgi:nucleoside phosphorylase
MGHVAQVRIGDVEVLAVKSELHLATDGVTAPIVALWQQIVAEVSPKLVITTGTAGGIGAATQLGDVFVVTNAKFNCTRSSRTSPGRNGCSPGRGSEAAGTRPPSTLW